MSKLMFLSCICGEIAIPVNKISAIVCVKSTQSSGTHESKKIYTHVHVDGSEEPFAVREEFELVTEKLNQLINQ